MQKNVIIIGAGASGLMAAIKAAEAGALVTVLEQNDGPGKKLLSTGNGRCNLTNVNQSGEFYRGTDPSFAEQALGIFGFQDTLRFFSRLGIYTVNRNGCLYPRSGQASQVRDVLVMEAGARGVKIRCSTGVRRMKEKEGGGFTVYVDHYHYSCDSLVLANGSAASVSPGSGDSGYGMAEKLGHTIVSPQPALVPLVSKEKYPWHGVRTEGGIRLFVDGKPAADAAGELQLTSYGISGIPVFEVSRYASRALAGNRKVTLEIDFFPDFDDRGFAQFLSARSQACPYKSRKELLAGLFPDRLIEVLCREGDLVSRVKAFPLTITGTKGFENAQVCSGGISTAEVNPVTMESYLCKGLYFAGEILDIDGTCGGYNLQWAWTSGAIAGANCAGNRKTPGKGTENDSNNPT